MYHKVGKGDPALTFRDWSTYPIVWNTPGWGSCSIPVSHVSIPGVKIATLLGIQPGGTIPLHKDNPGVENNVDGPLTRYHLILSTNDWCWNFHAGTWQQLEVGYMYTMDPTREHASINWGPNTRWHLILDIGQ